jgi:hypothetical protein
MSLEEFGKKAAAVSAIVSLSLLVGGIAGRLAWDLWLRHQVAAVVREEVAVVREEVAVVREEVADVRIAVAEVASFLGADEDELLKIRLRREFPPPPRP